MTEKLDYNAIIGEAFKAAADAAIEHHNENGQQFPAGFAWVRIKPARGPLVTALKKLDQRVYSMYVQDGLVVYNPSRHFTQSVATKEAGAYAFADVLKKYGLDCTVESRLD